MYHSEKVQKGWLTFDQAPDTTRFESLLDKEQLSKIENVMFYHSIQNMIEQKELCKLMTNLRQVHSYHIQGPASSIPFQIPFENQKKLENFTIQFSELPQVSKLGVLFEPINKNLKQIGHLTCLFKNQIQQSSEGTIRLENLQRLSTFEIKLEMFKNEVKSLRDLKFHLHQEAQAKFIYKQHEGSLTRLSTSVEFLIEFIQKNQFKEYYFEIYRLHADMQLKKEDPLNIPLLSGQHLTNLNVNLSLVNELKSKQFESRQIRSQDNFSTFNLIEFINFKTQKIIYQKLKNEELIDQELKRPFDPLSTNYRYKAIYEFRRFDQKETWNGDEQEEQSQDECVKCTVYFDHFVAHYRTDY